MYKAREFVGSTQPNKVKCLIVNLYELIQSFRQLNAETTEFLVTLGLSSG